MAAALAPLALLAPLAAWRRIVGALLVGLAYMAASYLIQGAFKETMQALFVLALRDRAARAGRGGLAAGRSSGRRSLAALPLAALAVGSVYAYSFPGLLWLAGAAGLWAVVELGLAARRECSCGRDGDGRERRSPAAAVALAAVALASAPEIGRMVDFASFETFDPVGSGPRATSSTRSRRSRRSGIWPSGDFRLDPGDGAMPAVGFYLGEALALAALAYGLAWWLRRGERAVPAALAVAAALFALRALRGHAVPGGEGDRDRRRRWRC